MHPSNGGRLPIVLIDPSLDFRTDVSGKDRDPDSHSPKLRQYHKFLWSKALPSGRLFHLDDTVPRVYLRHASDLGTFDLSSDTVIPTFTLWPAMRPITELFPQEENDAFRTMAYTIGGMMVFPGVKIGRTPTINQARGLFRNIADRLDLTLECIRRHYIGQGSPLGALLAQYGDFFALFDNFKGYVEFFLLQDLVNDDCSAVIFFMPFNDFKPPAVPKDGDTYREFRRRSIESIQARGRRISGYAASLQ